MDRIGNLFAALLVLSAFFWLVESLFAVVTPLITRAVSQIGLALILIAIYRENAAGIRELLSSSDTLLRQPAAFGLKGEEVPDGFWAQMLYAFRGRALDAG